MNRTLRQKYSPDKLRAIRKLFSQDVDAWVKIRKERETDMQCISTEQGPWPDAEWNARHAKGTERPCLHEDVLTQYVNQAGNQIEMNPMGVEATPRGEGATPESAEFVENRIRGIEYECQASDAYVSAAINAIQGSYGCWKLESARAGGFDQKVCIEPILDPESVVPGFAKKPDWSDLRRCWELERLSHEEFREKYKKRFPGIMGLVYTGNGYDIVMYLKKAWEAVGDPTNFKAVCDWVRANPDRGVCGFMDMRNEFQEAKHFPDNGFGNQSAELEKGMSQLYVQVQNVEHKIVYPYEIKESTLQPAPWWS